MSELKPRITENGIDYSLVGDYYIPDRLLTIPPMSISFSHSVILSHKKSIGLPSFQEDAARKRHPPWIYGKQTSCLISRTARTAAVRG